MNAAHVFNLEKFVGHKIKPRSTTQSLTTKIYLTWKVVPGKKTFKIIRTQEKDEFNLRVISAHLNLNEFRETLKHPILLLGGK